MWRAHTRQDNAAFSPNTNVRPAFGSLPKIERNRMLTSSIMRLNYGMASARTGPKPIETATDPLQREPALILARQREDMSIAGRNRGNIRAATPGMVNWKNPYWRAQRPPTQKPIGPFTQGSLEKQSILYRLSDSLSKIGRGY